MSKLWQKIVTSLPQKPLKPSSCNSFCWRLGSERMYLLLFGYMMGYGLDVLLTTRFCMLQKDMSDNSFFPTLTSPPVFSRSLACTRIGRLSSRLAHPPLTLRCLRNARKAPDGVGEDGRLPDSFLLPNSAIDKLLNASSRATLTGLTSAPAFAGVNTLHPMFGRFLVSGSPVCSAFEKFRLFGILSGFLGWFVVGFRMYWSLCQRMHDMPLLCTVKGLLSLLPARSLGRLGILGLNHFPGSGRLSSSPLMRSLATLVFCC